MSAQKIELGFESRFKMLGGTYRVKRTPGKLLLVRPADGETEADKLFKDTGIVTPDSAKERQRPTHSLGIIEQVGQEVPPGLYEVGELLMFSQHAGTRFSVLEDKSKNKPADLIVLELHEVRAVLESTSGPLEEQIVPVKPDMADVDIQAGVPIIGR